MKRRIDRSFVYRAPAPLRAAAPGFVRWPFLVLPAAALTVSGLAAAAPLRPESAIIEKGRQLFLRCTACHSRSAAARPGTGPHLEDIIGRPVASVPGFRYSAQLKAQSFDWTAQTLDRWLRKPQERFSGMCMPFAGFPRSSDRQALIAYLGSPSS